MPGTSGRSATPGRCAGRSASKSSWGCGRSSSWRRATASCPATPPRSPTSTTPWPARSTGGRRSVRHGARPEGRTRSTCVRNSSVRIDAPRHLPRRRVDRRHLTAARDEVWVCPGLHYLRMMVEGGPGPAGSAGAGSRQPCTPGAGGAGRRHPQAARRRRAVRGRRRLRPPVDPPRHLRRGAAGLCRAGRPHPARRPADGDGERGAAGGRAARPRGAPAYPGGPRRPRRRPDRRRVGAARPRPDRRGGQGRRASVPGSARWSAGPAPTPRDRRRSSEPGRRKAQTTSRTATSGDLSG